MRTRVKKICTIGPACRDPAILEKLLDRGMDIARLNFSHGTHETHGQDIRALKALRARRGVNLGILMDLSGPKIRLGEVRGEPVTVSDGQEIRLFPGTESRPGVSGAFPVVYPHLSADGRPGKRILIDDGLVVLTVRASDADGLVCVVEHGGPIRSRKGVNFPGQVLSATAPTEKDLDDLRFGLAAGADMAALSFVQSADDIRALRSAMENAGRIVPIIAKIERPTALERFDEILSEADAVMVARGDLGIEADISRIPVYQKQMIRACNLKGKPVITATQMLDSMIRNPTPTRAEATDVANAVCDNTDAVMLSGETAIGAFPVESIAMMDEIVCRVEADPDLRRPWVERVPAPGRESSEEALAKSTVDISAAVGARYIVAPTRTGQTAGLVSNARPGVPVLAVTASEAIFHQMSLLWGVEALLLPETESETTFLDTVERIEQALLKRRLVEPGEFVVVVGGMPPHRTGGTNVVKVHRIGSA